jgi:adenylate kinase
VELDGNTPEGVVLEEIVRILKLNRSKGPRRPPRILLMGPPGCGKTEHARKLAQKYKLQYVKVSEMVKDLARTEPNPVKAQELNARLESGKPFPNELIIGLVKERLERPDC